MSQSVAVLLISHDGERWLPAVIEGLRQQQVEIDRFLAVDTGSRDASAVLLDAAFGDVLRAPITTSFPAAVQLGLAQLAATGSEPEWIWLLHDDANPEPDALSELLAAAAADPGADILGPKLREWPSLKRLLELGVTISGTGRRETGLERGEYDQGQHDEVRTVLAVNTAGMLVRREVLVKLGGFDEQLPIFGNDLDFGWRAAAAGHRTVIVPQAVVFHAEAAHRGVRRTALTGRHTHYQERRAALFTVLVNSRARSLPFQLVRLGVGTVLRMIGFLLVRAVGEALDELAALISLYAHPREILAARRARRGQQVADPDDVRRLLAPPWLPYRHGLDFLGDLLAAATNQAQDLAERRRAAAEAAAGPSVRPGLRPGARPGGSDEDMLTEDTGVVARFLTNPIAVALALFVVLMLVATRGAWGQVAGGGLSPVPVDGAAWWHLHVESWHALGQGSTVPAPAYVLPLALLATLLGNSPGAALSVVFVLAVPGALWGAWRFLRVVGRLVDRAGAPRWVLLWGATTYALVPVVSGAWSDGRLGAVATTALLPWLAHAALGFADPDSDRRWRAAWRSALLLALVTCFTPVAWFFAVAFAVLLMAAGLLVAPSVVRSRSAWGPPAAALATVLLLLAPWWYPAVLEDAAEGLLLDIGRLPVPLVDSVDALTGRLGELGTPAWPGWMLIGLALLALVPRATRWPVLACWAVALSAAAAVAVLGSVTLDRAGTSTPAGLAFPVVLLQGAFVVAAAIGAQGMVARGGGDAWSAHRVLAVLLAGAAAVVPLAGLVWFVADGDERFGTGADTGIPEYMVQSSMLGPEHGILVVRGDVEGGLTYTVRRGDGITVGEDEIIDLTRQDADFTEDVQALMSRPTPQLVEAMAAHGIEYVVLPAPADGSVAAALDATGGLVQASAEDRSTRAWQVGTPVDPGAISGPRSWLRITLLALQGVGLVLVAVLCAPTSERRARR